MAARKKGVGGRSAPHTFSDDGLLELFPSGCALLDCVLGGGYPLGRIVNIWGDKSTGKTLLAMEAVANFAAKYPDSPIWYNETESAFDTSYAKNLGIPMDRVSLVDYCQNVEDVFEHMSDVIGKHPDDKPALYIIDSLDAPGTRREAGSDPESGYNTSKAMVYGRLFREHRMELRRKKVCLITVSQSRANLNAMMFGRKVVKSGGKSIDFFSSQVLFLAQIKQLTREVNKMKRAYGTVLKVKCDKNKIGPPFRECEFEILFSFGIDDIKCSAEFLSKVGALKVPVSEVVSRAESLTPEKYMELRERLRQRVFVEWKRIEDTFLPSRKKY